MEDVDEVSSTTKDEGVGDTVSSGSTTAIDPSSPHIGDSDEQSQGGNARKRKSTAQEGEEVKDEAMAESPTITTTSVTSESTATSAMEVDESNREAVSSSPAEEPMACSSSMAADPEPEPEVEVDLRVIYNKEPIPIKISLKKTVGDLKRMIETFTKIAPELQKVLVKGIPKDDVVLESLGLSAGSKVMVIGTKLDDVLAVNKTPTAAELKGDDDVNETPSSGDWCSSTRHQKIISKGVPEDAMPGILDCNDPLPDLPISGMVNSKGSKLRLTIKLEADELWIGTKERTEKVIIGSIRNILSQPIAGYEHYHILAIQLGPTEASRIFIYWFPAQYVMALKDALSH